MKLLRLKQIKDRGIGFILPVVLLITWEIGSRLELFPPTLLPGPAQISSVFADLLRNGSLVFNLKITIARVLAGFSVGILCGFILGSAMGLSRSVERYVSPLFHSLRQIPLFGWMPLLILWLGVGEVFKVVFIAIGSFYPMVLNTFKGIKGVQEEYVEVARVFEYNKLKLVQKVIFPAALPSIFTGIRLGLSLSWMSVVGAEFIASNTGIGYTMAFARHLFQLDTVIMGLIVIGIAGFIMDYLLKLAESYFLRWRCAFNAG